MKTEKESIFNKKGKSKHFGRQSQDMNIASETASSGFANLSRAKSNDIRVLATSSSQSNLQSLINNNSGYLLSNND